VRASPGFGPSALHLPAEVSARLSTLPFVRAVDSVREQRVEFRGGSITLTALSGDGLAARAPRVFLAGDRGAFSRMEIDRRLCVVSDVFARRFGMTMGETFTLETPTGVVSLSIAGIVSSFRAAVLIDRSLFVDRWGDDRVDTIYLALASPADVTRARGAVRSRLGATSALVSTRPEILAEWDRALAAVNAAMAITVAIALLAAVVGSATSLAVSAAERTREAGILRAIGATPRQMARARVLEALVLSGVSLALAAPLGDVLAWLLRARVADMVASIRLPAVYPAGVLGVLVVLLPIVAVAATWMPLGWARALGVTEAIAYE
jgi:putative ABC transport system permease protein